VRRALAPLFHLHGILAARLHAKAAGIPFLKKSSCFLAFLSDHLSTSRNLIAGH
jgi:hypothetical protein